MSVELAHKIALDIKNAFEAHEGPRFEQTSLGEKAVRILIRVPEFDGLKYDEQGELQQHIRMASEGSSRDASGYSRSIPILHGVNFRLIGDEESRSFIGDVEVYDSSSSWDYDL